MANQRVVRAGRNDLCSCGSGRKYKRCHGVTQGKLTRAQWLAVGGAVALVVAVLALVISSRESGPVLQRGVWSAEHGHYH